MLRDRLRKIRRVTNSDSGGAPNREGRGGRGSSLVPYVFLVVGFLLFAFGFWLVLAPFETTEYVTYELRSVKCGPAISEWGMGFQAPDADLEPCHAAAAKRAVPGTIAGLLGIVFVAAGISRKWGRVQIARALLVVIVVPALFYGSMALVDWRAVTAERRAASLVRLDQVDVVDLRLLYDDDRSWTPPTLTGRIRNHSPNTLVSVTLEFIASGDEEVVDRGTVTIHKVVPPGEARRFPPVDRGELAVPMEEATLQGAGGFSMWSYVPPVVRAKTWVDLLPPRPNTFVGPEEEANRYLWDDEGVTGFDFSGRDVYHVEVRLVGTRGR